MNANNRQIQIDTQSEPVIADGLKFKKISDEVIDLTPQTAEEFLNYETFAGERDVRQTHVQFLYDEFRRQQFMWDNVILAAAVLWEKSPAGGPPKQHVYRINGQHTCWMRYLMPAKFARTSFKVRKVIYAVENMEQLRSLYSVWDRNAPRTTGHITKVLLVNSPATAGIAPSYITALTAGFRYWQWEDQRDRMTKGTPSETAALIQHRFCDLFRLVGQYYAAHYNTASWLHRSPVVAALFATFHKSAGAAPLFWDSVTSGLGLEEGTDPRHKLRMFILAHNLDRGKNSITQEEQFRICIQAWNRWRKKEAVSNLRPTASRVAVLS